MLIVYNRLAIAQEQDIDGGSSRNGRAAALFGARNWKFHHHSDCKCAAASNTQ